MIATAENSKVAVLLFRPRNHSIGRIAKIEGGRPESTTSTLPITMNCLESAFLLEAAVVIGILIALKL